VEDVAETACGAGRSARAGAQGQYRQSTMHLTDKIDIEALRLRHGYDFSEYAPASFKRRVQALADKLKARSISELTERLIHDEALIGVVIEHLSVPVSELFREPRSFRVLRERVLPELASFPHLNVWQAGCANGEEVYSLAAILHECGLYERTQIYATDISDAALAKAADGIYPARELALFTDNYHRAGGTASLDRYFTHRYDLLKVDEELKRNITFANHNLVSDGVFGEMHLVLCRNVLIYFSDALQNRVLRLFRDSLGRGGYLCLGSKETLSLSEAARDFRPVMPGVPVFALKSRG
jgi:chemotaxis protein methyltransferase CheR